jgi:hypothetical protein
LPYQWWEPVYFLDPEGKEMFGQWAGIAPHEGDELTFVVVNPVSSHAVYQLFLLSTISLDANNICTEIITADHLEKSGEKSAAQQGTGECTFTRSEGNTEEQVYPTAPADLVGKIF